MMWPVLVDEIDYWIEIGQTERIYHSKFTVSKVNKISSSETKMKLCGVKIIIAQSDPLDLIFL